MPKTPQVPALEGMTPLGIKPSDNPIFDDQTITHGDTHRLVEAREAWGRLDNTARRRFLRWIADRDHRGIVVETDVDDTPISIRVFRA